MRDYELTVVLHPDLEIDLDKPLKKVEKILTDNGGKIIKQDNWGKRKLAYQIQKEDYGVYVHNEVQLEPTSINDIEKALNITKECLRYLITHPVPVQSEEETDKAKKEAKAESKKDDKVEEVNEKEG